MPNQATKELYKRVKILSITPIDKYNLVEMKGNLILDTVEVGKTAVVTFDNSGMLRTSKIEEISKTESKIEIETKNSKYSFEIVKEEC